MRLLPFRFRPRFVTRLVLIALVAIVMVNPAMLGLAQIDVNDPLSSFRGGPELTSQRLEHILHGDRSGGGHLHGTGKPCKSEFPKNWDAEKIETVVTQIADNDNVLWKKQGNGYDVTTVRVEDVSVRVVLNPAKNEIVTAYPVGVQRNPCPAPANDNNE